MAKAWVVRRAILEELNKGRPVMVLGVSNGGEHSAANEITSGEIPFHT